MNSYNLVKDLQIEVLKNQIYLNCSNLIKLGKIILNENQFLDKNAFCKGMNALGAASKKFSKEEETFGLREVYLCTIYDENGKPYSEIPHYTIVEDKATIHATSNVRRIFSQNQRVDGVIADLVKNNSIAPGTVITVGYGGTKKISNKTIWVPNSQIDAVRANHEEFEVHLNIRNYQKEKEEAFAEILKDFFKLEGNIRTDLLRKFHFNEFARDLNNSSFNDFQTQYETIFKEFLKNKNRDGYE